MIRINGYQFDIRDNEVYVNGKRMVPADGGPLPGSSRGFRDLFGRFRSGDVHVSMSGVRAGGDVVGGDKFESGGDRTLTLDRDGRVVGNIDGDLTVIGQGQVTLVIEGTVNGNVTSSDAVTCRQVNGDVAATTVNCDRINGSVTASAVNMR